MARQARSRNETGMSANWITSWRLSHGICGRDSGTWRRAQRREARFLVGRALQRQGDSHSRRTQPARAAMDPPRRRRGTDSTCTTRPPTERRCRVKPTPSHALSALGSRSQLQNNGAGGAHRLTPCVTECVDLPWVDCGKLIEHSRNWVFWHHWPDSKVHDGSGAGQGLDTLSRDVATRARRARNSGDSSSDSRRVGDS